MNVEGVAATEDFSSSAEGHDPNTNANANGVP
jgi:hypothetical protein